MRDFLEYTLGLTILRWREPTDAGELCEALFRGMLIRADSPLLLYLAVLEGIPAHVPPCSVSAH